MEHFPTNFEHLNDDIGLQPEVISVDLPLSEQLQGYAGLLQKAEREPVESVYQKKLIDHYQKMIALLQKQGKESS